MTAPVGTAVALAPDPVLPRRDALLDAGLVASRFQRLLRLASGDQAVRGCTRVRAKYRMGESLRVTYRMDGDSGSWLVSARMFAAHKASVQFARAHAAVLDQGADPDSVLFDESLDTVFWVFPQDRKLRGLRELIRPTPGLRDVFQAPWVRSDLVAYTPEKAATVRCLDESGSVVGFAKVQSGDEGRRSVAVLAAARRGLEEREGLRLPEPVGYLPEHHLALTSAAPGRPLHQLARDAVPAAMTALGQALSILHRQPTDGFDPFTRLDADRVAAAADLVDAARPDLAKLTQPLVAQLVAAAPQGLPRMLLHGDLHPKNVLVHDTGVSLVDLDQAGAGPAAAELGGTLARLWCPRPGDEIDPATAAAAGDALLAAYDRPPARPVLLWYAAAALLVERAVRAVSRIDDAALHDLDRVLSTALDWAAPRTDDGR